MSKHSKIYSRPPSLANRLRESMGPIEELPRRIANHVQSLQVFHLSMKPSTNMSKQRQRCVCGRVCQNDSWKMFVSLKLFWVNQAAWARQVLQDGPASFSISTTSCCFNFHYFHLFSVSLGWSKATASWICFGYQSNLIWLAEFSNLPLLNFLHCLCLARPSHPWLGQSGKAVNTHSRNKQ